MPVVIEDFEVIEEPPPAPAAAAPQPDTQAATDIDVLKLDEALARRRWSLQRLHAD